MDLSFWNATEKFVIDKLQPLFAANKFVIELDGKVKPMKKLTLDLPWVFIRGRDFGDCYLYREVFFDVFGIVPAFCQYFCWKTIIKPRTVVELFKLYEVLRRLNYPGKCGIEVRPHVKGSYGGYVYNNGKEEGLSRQPFIRKAVDEDISPDIPIYLKRGCTEFEHAIPTSKWQVSPDQNAVEQILMAIFQPESVPVYQPQWIVNHVKRSWIYQAWNVGDETFKELLPEEDWELFPKTIDYLTYEEKGEEGADSAGEDQ